MSIITDKSNRLFLKSISLLEETLKLKVKNAILMIDTDFGEFEFVLKENPELLILQEKFFHQRLLTVIRRKYAGQLITCDLCLGNGEVLEGDVLLKTCPKCKGGGQVAISVSVEAIEQLKTTIKIKETKTTNEQSV